MSDELPVYSVTVSREGDLWVAVVDGLSAGATDVERFAELPDAVRDLICTLLDLEPDDFWIDWRYRQGEHDLTDLVAHLRQWDAQADRATRNRDRIRWLAMTSMHSAGLSYREIADVVGLSHQRVGQVLSRSDADAVPMPTLAPVGRAQRGEAENQTPSPAEAALAALLDSVRSVRPDARHALLTTTASLLQNAANDPEFLQSQ